MFFNNDFEAVRGWFLPLWQWKHVTLHCVVGPCMQAEAHFAREKNRLPVFALGHATLAFMRAMMTFGKPEIQEAAERLHHTLVSIHRHSFARTRHPNPCGYHRNCPRGSCRRNRCGVGCLGALKQ
jgi:Protein of unknown function (DUF3808)